MIIRAFAQMRQLQQAQPGISPRELLECVTTNAAGALRQSDALRRIRAGFLTHLIALPFTGASGDVLAKLVAHEGKSPARW